MYKEIESFRIRIIEHRLEIRTVTHMYVHI